MDMSKLLPKDTDDPVKHQLAKLVLSTVGGFLMKQMIEVYYDHVRNTEK